MSEKGFLGRGNLGRRSGIERRQWVRYTCNPDTSCQILDPAGAGTGRAEVQDVSAAGICLLIDRRFEPGCVLAIELENTTHRFLRRLFVHVAHVKECAEGGWLHGGSFATPLSDEELLAFV